MSLEYRKTISTFFLTMAGACALSLATPTSAQVATPLPKQGKTEAQCSYGGGEGVQVLYREGKAPWANFQKFLQTKRKDLQKKLKKQRKSKKATQAALKKLTKRLTDRNNELLKLCAGGAGGSTGPSAGSGEGLAPVAKQGGVTLYVYRSSQFKHSFVFDVTTQGAISGTLYKGDPVLDPSSTGAGSGPGNRIFLHGLAANSPFVWAGNKLKKMCDNCSGLTIGALNDTDKIAIGTKNVGTPGAQPSGVLFNYATGATADLPQLRGRGVDAADINATGLVLGSVESASGHQDAVVVTKNGAVTELQRSTIMSALDSALLPLVLAQVKRELYQGQDTNECSDAEIESTRMVGSPVRALPPHILGIRVSDAGYLLGAVVDRLGEGTAVDTWRYQGLCRSGVFNLIPGSHTLVVKPGNFMQVIPSSAVPYVDGSVGGFVSGTTINNLGQVAGSGFNDIMQGLQIARLDARRGDVEWGLTPLNSGAFAQFMPSDMNDKGALVGVYTPDLTTQGGRACLVTPGNQVVDLGDLMGIKRDSGLVLTQAVAVNSCGTIVGNSYSEKTKQYQLFIMNPDGCPMPS